MYSACTFYPDGKPCVILTWERERFTNAMFKACIANVYFELEFFEDFQKMCVFNYDVCNGFNIDDAKIVIHGFVFNQHKYAKIFVNGKLYRKMGLQNETKGIKKG